MTVIKFVLGATVLVAVAIIAARYLYPLPSLSGVRDAPPVRAADSGQLHEAVTLLIAAHPGQSGLHPLPDAAAAFAARVILARAATQSIDVQYYIWHRDLTGVLLLDELRKSAGRGVHVRLLLDDNGISDLDPILSELDAHPNFEIRLYNPFTTRDFKLAGYAFDFFRLNRRMHNKSFTVDGLVTIGGGRNVGDEYFGTGLQPSYVDLDLLAAGSVVQDVSDDFARYWNSASAYPLDLLVDDDNETDGALQTAFDEVSQGPQRATYETEIRRSDVVRKLISGTLPLEWTPAILVSDPPTKTLGQAAEEELLVGQLDGLMGDIDERLDVISPYFVPGEKGTEHFVELAERGVRVRILTNSMEATDVLPVHAGYAKYRHRLVEAGVELYELKASAAPQDRKSDTGFAGSSAASLHAKSFAVDGERIYIGSFNFDPRSVYLNTEMGLLVDSEQMAQDMHTGFEAQIADMAYAVSLDDDGQLQWTEQQRDGSVRHFQHDPNSSAGSRAAITVIGWLPIQWLL